MKKKLFEISEFENLKISEETVNKLIETSDGDMRNAITTLQNAAHIYKEELANKNGPNAIYEILGEISDNEIKSIFKKLKKATFNNIQEITYELINNGFIITNIMQKISKFVIYNKNINDTNKGKFSIKISQIESYLTNGANEYLQLFNVLVLTQKLMNNEL